MTNMTKKPSLLHQLIGQLAELVSQLAKTALAIVSAGMSLFWSALVGLLGGVLGLVHQAIVKAWWVVSFGLRGAWWLLGSGLRGVSWLAGFSLRGFGWLLQTIISRSSWLLGLAFGVLLRVWRHLSIIAIVHRFIKRGLIYVGDKFSTFWHWLDENFGVNSWRLIVLARTLLIRFKKVWLKRWQSLVSTYEDLVQVLTTLLVHGKDGKLAPSVVLQLAVKNLWSARSRTAITVGAIAAGTAAIVFLVGFAYGLQLIVTNRLVQPNSLRLADIQSSSTALELNQEAIESIESFAGVADVAPAMSLAGSLSLAGSRTEVIVIGARNAFLDYSHLEMIVGETFSPEAESLYVGETTDLDELMALKRKQNWLGQVAGAADDEDAQPSPGQPITGDETSFRILDSTYLPIRSRPSLNAPVLGYVRGSVVETYQGLEVWGGVYESTGTAGRAFQTLDGTWLGRWLRVADLPVYDEVATSVYLPRTDEAGHAQQAQSGYLTQVQIALLRPEEARADIMIESLLDEYLRERAEGQVLGEADGADEASEADGADQSSEANQADETDEATAAIDVATDSAVADLELATLLATEQESLDQPDQAESDVLRFMFDQEQAALEATASAVSAIIGLPREGGKEVLVSTGLLNVWDLDPGEVLGTSFELEYIVSGGLIRGASGRVVSEPITYQVVGVFRDDEQSVIYTPLSDLESMGVQKYTTAKILAGSSEELPLVRDRVEALGFLTRSIADTLHQVERLFAVMRFLLGSFGMIAFIVALFGMFNTLTVSLLERTREIGVMKTLGTTDQDVIKLMISESTIIGLMGGAMGIVLGILVGFLVDWSTSFFRDAVDVSLFHFPIPFLVMVFGLVTIVGIFTGLYPARRAQKITALDALRYE